MKKFERHKLKPRNALIILLHIKPAALFGPDSQQRTSASAAFIAPLAASTARSWQSCSDKEILPRHVVISIFGNQRTLVMSSRMHKFRLSKKECY